MPRQFEVFDNPIGSARGAMPFVAVLQSDLTAFGQEVVVAPLTADIDTISRSRRLLPAVSVSGCLYALLVPRLATLRVRDLKHPVAEVGASRDSIIAALDLLFLGI